MRFVAGAPVTARRLSSHLAARHGGSPAVAVRMTSPPERAA
jgi:hypothetical protein